MPDEQTPWVVKGVPNRTRRLVKVYAAERNVTMAEALEQLIDAALGTNTEDGSDAGSRAPVLRLRVEGTAVEQANQMIQLLDEAFQRWEQEGKRIVKVEPRAEPGDNE
jgi:tRNA A-37 threonylcarbamoyl transferase component Bud32